MRVNERKRHKQQRVASTYMRIFENSIGYNSVPDDIPWMCGGYRSCVEKFISLITEIAVLHKSNVEGSDKRSRSRVGAVTNLISTYHSKHEKICLECVLRGGLFGMALVLPDIMTQPAACICGEYTTKFRNSTANTRYQSNHTTIYADMYVSVIFRSISSLSHQRVNVACLGSRSP